MSARMGKIFVPSGDRHAPSLGGSPVAWMGASSSARTTAGVCNTAWTDALIQQF